MPRQKQMQEIKKDIKEQIQDMVRFYSLQFNPCKYCAYEKRKTGAELELCKSCCYYYPSKFELRS